jgi:shikimate kinase
MLFFEMKGEIKFRKMEHEAFVELLNALGMQLLVLGRNSCYANNHELLNEDVLSIYLGHQLIPYSIDWLFNKKTPTCQQK